MRWALTVVAMACVISFIAGSRTQEKTPSRVQLSNSVPRVLPKRRFRMEPMELRQDDPRFPEVAARVVAIEEFRELERDPARPMGAFWEATTQALSEAQSMEEREEILQMEILAVGNVIKDADDLLDFLERMQLAHPDSSMPLYYRAQVLAKADRPEEALRVAGELREKIQGRD